MQDIRRGDVFYAVVMFSDRSGSKIRPVVVVSSDVRSNSANDVLVVPVSGSNHRLDIPTNIPVGNACGLDASSVADCGSLATIAKIDFRDYLGNIGPELLARLDAGIDAAFGRRAVGMAGSDPALEAKLSAYREVLRDFMSA